jgi:class 3 adenylate cyclase
LLAVFPLASNALDTAAAIAIDADGLGIGVRAGVHIAEVANVGDDILGLGVTIAARALGEASGGEVVTMRAVADTVAGSKRQFESLGGFNLKGVSGEWELLTAIHP